MSPQVKIDEDLPAQVAQSFADHGYNATTVSRQGWQGIADEILEQRVQVEGRWLVAGDKGFADLRLHAPGTHNG